MSSPLLHQPLWRPADLGQPIPSWPHATSVCLPTWADNVGYEEGEERVLSQLRCGYPRFVLHRWTEELHQVAATTLGTDMARVFGVEATACRAAAYIGGATVREFRGAWAVGFAESAKERAKQFWQHGGEGVSWRQARALLDGVYVAEFAGADARSAIADLAGVPAADVFLFSSGMAAVYAAWRCVTDGDAPTIQFGFPYIDTLKIQQRFGNASQFFANCATADHVALESLESASAVFCEVPANPLLQMPDVPRLARWCRERGVPLVVDDTVATFANVDLMPHADLIASSLTKFVSGLGDVMAGSLILNPRSAHYARLRARLAAEFAPSLWCEDAAVLRRNAAGFQQRIMRINRNGEALADFLYGHPEVARVYYPKYQDRAHYDALLRKDGGYGGLLSFLLRTPQDAEAVYDRLEVCKGPSLGTEFTLVSPYTILAHYDELAFAESCGVSRYLLRVSAGIEPDLIDRFEKALSLP